MSAGRTGALAVCAAILAALAGAPAAAAQATFPPTPVGASSADQDIVLINDGPDPVELGLSRVSGEDAAAFQVVGETCVAAPLASGDACRVIVAFRAARIGTHAATLHVPVVGEPDAPFSAALSGEGIPWLRLTPSVLDFGTVFGLSFHSADVLVENVSGRETSLLARIDPPGRGFSVSRVPAPDRCGSSLAVGATCRTKVTFRPLPGTGAAEARLVFGGSVTESVTLRGTEAPRVRTPTAPILYSTPDATAVLRKGLRVALARLRGRSRPVLLKRGLVVRGIVAPAQGVLRVVVERRASSGSIVVATRRPLAVQPGRAATIRARLTRAGRRLLRSGRPLVLDVSLTLVASLDSRVSEATRVLRLARVRHRR